MNQKISFDKSKTASFTGYRSEKFPFPFKNSTVDYNTFELKLLDTIDMCIKDGYTTFLTGACEGFDILAAELVLLLKKAHTEAPVRLVCIVPFDGQEKKWNKFWQTRYRSVLERADEVIVLSPKYYSGCFYARNRFLIDNSSLIICYYDGQSGGTKYTLDYNANNKKSRIINVAEN